MSISTPSELSGMQGASEAVAVTLQKMRDYARPGMSTKELDEFGGTVLQSFQAVSAPILAYKFPGHTCICVNKQVAHGIPSTQTILQCGDLVNIDVSAELNGFWADNGGSFVLGEDIHQHQPLVDASRQILKKAIAAISGGVWVSDVGFLIETEAKKRGLKVIHNLVGHGIGRQLHEEPSIANFRDRSDLSRFKKNSVVAVETFIATASTMAVLQHPKTDKWTLVGNKGGFVAQHEHTLMVTSGAPNILTRMNGIWD